MPRSKKMPVSLEPVTPLAAEVAFERVLPELDAVKAHELAPMNLDVTYSVKMVLGKLEGIRLYEPQLLGLPELDPQCIQKLETYALAAWFAHIEAQPNPQQPRLRALLEEALSLRSTLLVEADALVHHGLFEASAVAAVRAGQGHADLANDLVALSGMYRKIWEALGGRTLVTEASVKRAGVLGTELLAALGVRAEGGTLSEREANDTKARAFTLFARAYDEVRRGLAFLRWREGDADEIAPSLYRKGGRAGARTEPESDEEAPTDPTPVAPGVANGEGAPT